MRTTSRRILTAVGTGDRSLLWTTRLLDISLPPYDPEPARLPTLRHPHGRQISTQRGDRHEAYVQLGCHRDLRLDQTKRLDLARSGLCDGWQDVWHALRARFSVDQLTVMFENPFCRLDIDQRCYRAPNPGKVVRDVQSDLDAIRQRARD
jgi:hypothetical protein